MTPDIARRYAVTLRYWQEEVYKPGKKSQLPKPLPFFVPQDQMADVANMPLFGSYMDEHRLYADKPIGWGCLFESIQWFMVLAVVLLVLRIIFNTTNDLTIPGVYWLGLIAAPIMYYVLKFVIDKTPREACHVFERDTGLVYLYCGKNKPYQKVDFYEQYFSSTSATIDMNDFGSLLLRSRIKQADGSFTTLGAMSVASGGSKKDGLEAWHLLVRFMDKSIPFSDDELKFFNYVAAEKRKQGYKIKAIVDDDGGREVF